jgi:hypothetical protein
MEAGNISIQALDYVLGQDLDGLAQLREGLQSAQGARLFFLQLSYLNLASPKFDFLSCLPLVVIDKELVEFCHDLLRGAYEEAHKHPFVANLFSLDDGACIRQASATASL